MGGAGVSHVNDASSSYWNPAGLAFSKTGQLFFMNQSWIAGIDHSPRNNVHWMPNIYIEMPDRGDPNIQGRMTVYFKF